MKEVTTELRKIISIIIIILFVFLCLVAFVEPVRAFVYQAVGPTLQGFFGDAVASITTSAIWQNWITPWPNQLLIGMILMIPIAIFVHNSFNRIRTVFVRSAYRETGAVTMTEPISSVSQAPEPQSIATEKTEKKESSAPPAEKEKSEQT